MNMPGMNMGGGAQGNGTTWCAPGDATPMFTGFGGLTQNGLCTLFLFPSGQLDTSAKYFFAWVGTVALALAVDAIAYFRRKHVVRALADSPALRRAADSLLFAAQIVAAYWVMLVVMTYSGPLFVAVLVGLTLGHAVFTEYSAAPDCVGDATCCNPVMDAYLATGSTASQSDVTKL